MADCRWLKAIDVDVTVISNGGNGIVFQSFHPSIYFWRTVKNIKEIHLFFIFYSRTLNFFTWRDARIFLYLIYHDFSKINGRFKIFDKYTSGAVAHGTLSFCRRVGHANGRQSWPVGLGTWRRGQRRQDPWRCGPRRQGPGAAAPAPGARLYKGPSHCRRPSLLPPSTINTYGFQPLRSASEVCF
jgi:hypothetical protein